MKCEACGGDGQIEYGAYRGDEAGPTRECRLCGGVAQITETSVSGGVQNAVRALTQISQAAVRAGDSVGKWASDTVVRDNVFLKTAQEIADKHLEQLRLENERKQAEAELKESRRAKVESELRLLEMQRGAYIAKGTENIANKYEQDLRRELQRDTNDTMNDLIRRSML